MGWFSSRFRVSTGTGEGGPKKGKMLYVVKPHLFRGGGQKMAKMLYGVKFGPVLHQKNA